MAVWFSGAEVFGQTINWFSDPNQTNRTSTGLLMDSGFRFELGVFTGSFVPTAANKADWASHWTAADRTSYISATRRFDRQFDMENNTTLFTAGKATYVWGFNGDAANGEWIIFRANTWTWPTYDSNNISPPLVWSAAAATAVLGAIHSNGSPFLLQSAAVGNAAPPSTTWTQWQVENLSDEPLNGPSQDPDHDGVSNLLEFVFGTSPTSPGAPTPIPVSLTDIGGQKFLQITIPRRIDHPATLTVQVSGDLTQWNSDAGETLAVEDSVTALVVRDLTPFNSIAPKRFMRLKVTLP